MDKQSNAGMRKRQQMAKSSRMMFMWIVGVSAIVGFSVVLIIFLAQRIWYGEKVIAEKQETVSVLTKNLEVVPDLQDNVRLLNTNESLQSVRLDENDSAIQVILDALPADANSTAMASSLQTKLLSGVNGVVVESMRVEPVSGVETDAEGSDASSGTIEFSFTVSVDSGNEDGLRNILQRIERSIRPFTITNLVIEAQEKQVSMSATGFGYYEPAQKVELVEKAVKP